MTEFELERQAEIAHAQLLVAKDFGVSISILMAVIAHLFGIMPFLWVPVAIATYYVVTLRYRQNASRSQDAYDRVARLGKYYDLPPDYGR